MRTKTLQSKTTEEEMNILKEAAMLTGLRLNSFTRSAAIEKARKILKENKVEAIAQAVLKMVNERIKIITNSGYKYLGEEISRDETFIEILDLKEGLIKIPINNISFMKEVSQ